MRGVIWGICGVIVAGVLASAPRTERDAKIAAVQTLLREQRLYPGEITGINDRETEAAIRRFQMLRSLRVTGSLNEETLARMNLPTASPPPAAVVEADREFLRGLQAPAQPPVAEATGEENVPRAVPANALPIPRETVRNFLGLYLKAASRKDPQPELTYYADEVDYFDQGRVNREKLAEELDRSHQGKLPRMELLDLETVVESSPNTVEARFTVRTTPPGKRRAFIEKREATLQRSPGGAVKLIRVARAGPE